MGERRRRNTDPLLGRADRRKALCSLFEFDHRLDAWMRGCVYALFRQITVSFADIDAPKVTRRAQPPASAVARVLGRKLLDCQEPFEAHILLHGIYIHEA